MKVHKTFGYVFAWRIHGGEPEVLTVAETLHGEVVYKIPGGGKEKHESPRQAAVRELREETSGKVNLDSSLQEIWRDINLEIPTSVEDGGFYLFGEERIRIQRILYSAEEKHFADIDPTLDFQEDEKERIFAPEWRPISKVEAHIHPKHRALLESGVELWKLK